MTTLPNYFKSLTVIETATILAGPAVGMFLAELGATVIKVENIKTDGDTTRGWKSPTENPATDISAYFSAINWGKLSLGLNLSHPDGQRVLHELLAQADIFIHNFQPTALARFQLDHNTLDQINKQLISAKVMAYSDDDPRPGFDAIMQAETGFTAINGLPESGPTKMPVALIDVLLAHQMKEAILLALLERILTGKGQHISLSLFQSGVASLVNQATNYLVAHTIPTRRGSDHPNISPYGTIFTTKDGRDLVLAVGTEAQFKKLVIILGCPRLVEDSRFQTNTLRVEHNVALKAILSDYIAQFERDDLLQQLHTAQVPAGPLYSMDDVFKQPLAQAMLITGQLANNQSITGVRSIAFSSNAVNRDSSLSPPPHFNQHRDEVLKTTLGYTDQTITELHNQGVVK